MREEEAAEALWRVMESELSGLVVVSRGELQERLSLWLEGKEDRKRATRRKNEDLGKPVEIGRNDIEEAVRLIWKQLLGIDDIGIHNNFFELGGHSLLATQLMTRIREAFSIDIPLRALFDGPTVAELSLAILERQAELAGDQELAELLAEVDELPQEVVEAMLAAERQTVESAND